MSLVEKFINQFPEDSEIHKELTRFHKTPPAERIGVQWNGGGRVISYFVGVSVLEIIDEAFPQ